MNELIGKFAYKKRGFYSDLIGKIEHSNSGITPYKLVFKSGGSVGFHYKEDVVIVSEEDLL